MNTPFRLPLDGSRQAALTTPLRLLLATTAAFWMGTAQPQVATTAATRQVNELRFRNFFRPHEGSTGFEISDTLRQANGQTVRLVGYMVQQDDPTPGRFMLTPRPVRMSKQANGAANDLPPATVAVHLDTTQQDWTVPHVSGLVTVNGKLSVNHHEERGERVSWVHLQLDTEAARSMNAFELTGYLHSLQHPQPSRTTTRRIRMKSGQMYPVNPSES